ncbi:EipB family protein [Acuticoccus mangrovi]|uniref:Cell envelope integrity EipB family protein n=1 Tax=Acuticoccus mangrovi TaxID=2796142 RepID=A0A934ICN2_9HYPH|nr:DUF1849 family protein [Acuticoccus mangrovi]MBJ3774079.1 cell envelope integrity EipB family protein [Acuticoccus mangrovi]
MALTLSARTRRLLRRRVAPALLGAVAASVGVAGAAQAAGALVPHRAVYDVTLSRAEASASMISAKGRLVFELSGARCEGYVVNSRFVTRVMDREGNSRVTDLRSSTFEAMDPAEFTFLNQTYIDDNLASEVKGSAEAKAGGVEVTLTAPKQATLELGRALFPTAHTQLILDSAAAGERVLEAPIFDGGDNADTLYDSTTVIGPERTDLPGASEEERAKLSVIENAEAMKAWRLVISYFAADGGTGEKVPDYELTFTLLENGISYDVMFDYGAFALTGRLSELELREAPDC